MDQLTTFNVSQYLDSEEMVLEYISQVLQDADKDELLKAIEHIFNSPINKELTCNTTTV